MIHRLDPGAEPGGRFDTLGHYVHTLARTPEGWKITRVKQSVAWNGSHRPEFTGSIGAMSQATR